MIESMAGSRAGIGDFVCLIDKVTQLPVSSEFEVIGIAYRSGLNDEVEKFLYLSDGNCAYNSDEVRVVQKLLSNQETSND